MKTKKIFTFLVFGFLVAMPVLTGMLSTKVAIAAVKDSDSGYTTTDRSTTNWHDNDAYNGSNGGHMMNNGYNNNRGYDNDNHRFYGSFNRFPPFYNSFNQFPSGNVGIICIPRPEWGLGYFNQFGVRCVPNTSFLSPFINPFNVYGY